MYDSRKDTEMHIERVRMLIRNVTADLEHRAVMHDKTKLEEPEKTGFDNAGEIGQHLKDVEYESDEYKEFRKNLDETLQHHYKHNRHHPEHFTNGIHGMSLIDLIEMLLDWKAASERHAKGDIYQSIETNQERFGYSDELKQFLINTAGDLYW